MSFGENLINLRKQNKMTQEQVAEKLQISRQTVSNWELNQTKPDLDQLIGLSKLYHVSLDKLADIDIKNVYEENKFLQKTMESNLLKCKRFLIENKKVGSMILALICIIAMGICAMVDYVLNDKITWSAVPIVSIVFGYGVILSLFVKKRKSLKFLLAITIAILPYLYLLEFMLPIKDWYYALAVPITMVALIGLWLSYFIYRYLRINDWYKAAIFVFMWAGVLSPIINHIANDLPYLSFQNFTNYFSSSVISLLCIIYGYIRSTKKVSKR